MKIRLEFIVYSIRMEISSQFIVYSIRMKIGLGATYERDLSHMVKGPTSPSLTALSGTRVSENSLEPSPAGISDLRAEISR